MEIDIVKGGWPFVRASRNDLLRILIKLQIYFGKCFS